MKTLFGAIAGILAVAVAQAQVGPPGVLWRGSSGPGSYTTTGPGGYAVNGGGNSSSGGGGGGTCSGVIDLSVGCALPMLGGVP